MLFMGVDAGGTKCRARLENEEGRVLGIGRGGPANIRRGADEVTKTIRQACDQAFQDAGLEAYDTNDVALCIGIAGIRRQNSASKLIDNLRSLYHGPLDMISDAEIANVGAHGGDDGGTVIAGTGSVGIACVDDEIIRVGGYGFPISDLGSGAFIGLKAVQTSLLAIDGLIDESELSAVMLNYFDHDLTEIVAWQDKATPTDYATFAPVVVSCAEANDQAAQEIMRTAAGHIGNMLQTLKDFGAPRLSLAGGLGPPLRNWLEPSLAEQVSDLKGDPLSGALLLARKLI